MRILFIDVDSFMNNYVSKEGKPRKLIAYSPGIV